MSLDLPPDLTGRLALLLHCSRRNDRSRRIDPKMLPIILTGAAKVLEECARFGVRITLDQPDASVHDDVRQRLAAPGFDPG